MEEQNARKISSLFFAGQDLHHEEEISRNPFHLKSWTNYLAYKKDAKPAARYLIYERALKFLPRSYKLWHPYLQERMDKLESKSVCDKGYDILVNTFERSLVHLHKMPRIWRDYCSILVKMGKGTSARKGFDRALQSLPITQHKDLWTAYIAWAKDFGVEETAVRVYRRFLMYDPSQREHFVSFLESVGHFGEAARQLAACVNDDHYISPSGQSRHQMWMRLCDICASHPDSVSGSLNVEAIIRSGIARFSDEVGRLWCRLADYYVRQGHFEKARDIYEEAINTVTTVKDFTIVFDAYAKIEESVLTAKIRMKEEPDSDDDDAGDQDPNDIEMRLARLEYLMEKRPVLLNSVVLRQNPHNVFEWHKRIKLFKNDGKQTLLTFMEAVKTVDPKLATGKLSGIWLSFARFYEKSKDFDSARAVLTRATQVNFKSVDELAMVWCGWGEMEMRHEEFDRALAVMQQAVAEPPSSVRRRKARAAAQGKSKGGEEDGAEETLASDKIHKNVKVWSLYLDLEENVGTVQTCRAAYDRSIDIKVCTAQMALNYAVFLEENGFFEDSFRVYEQAVALFTFPQLKVVWTVYLDKFIERYAGTKLERLRDLFEQSVERVPADDAAEFFIKYAKAEETFGLARHAMSVYDRATRAVPDAARLDMYRLYIKKVEQFFGVTKTRPVYERAIAELNDDHCRDICLEFSSMERKLGEVDRARSILQHGSQFADPRRVPAYWHQWKEFEEAHGNEDTFRDMLRVQRSVETAFSQVNYLAAEMLAGESLAAMVPASSANTPQGTIDAMSQRAEQKAREQAASGGGAPGSQKRKFVPASTAADQGGPAAKHSSKAGAVGNSANPDEIDIDAGEDGDEEEEIGIVSKPVPLAVFGSAHAAAIAAAGEGNHRP